ncbi:AcrR family transcriptional regulator [Kibdelosporangium banguiense]|uniref:AcrR family transcriptional regulator n=1 Tax=Kibdelosporangium banguiense TaxID=1365924 RepID=A0ABS4T804_9PSEU|nr:TetR/AcrR family transcriptional regulator [Kibdelosporangium banguiense]MBP2320064.1 AcrR family transcriptional regulator [Kibdelosporangium banguiense]
MSSLGRIQRTAVRLFADHGFAATGIREISRGAGLNSATLYHYAGGKEELLVTVMRDCLHEILRAGREALAPTEDPAVQLVRLVRAHVAVEAINPLTAKVTDREVHSLTGDNHTEILAIRHEYEGLFRDVLRRGAKQQFHITDLSITRLAVMEMCNGVANWYRPGGRLTVAGLQDRFAELACRMVGSRPVDRTEYEPGVVVPRLESEPEEDA